MSNIKRYSVVNQLLLFLVLALIGGFCTTTSVWVIYQSYSFLDSVFWAFAVPTFLIGWPSLYGAWIAFAKVMHSLRYRRAVLDGELIDR